MTVPHPLPENLVRGLNIAGALVGLAGNAIEGIGAVALFAAPEPTMVTKAGGVVLAGLAVDGGQANLRTLYNLGAEPTPTFLNQGVTAATGLITDPQTARFVGGATDGLAHLGGTIYAGGQIPRLFSTSVGAAKLVGFNEAEGLLIQDSLKALRHAGYDTSPLREISRADLPPGYRAMSLDGGAALGSEALSSQAALNSALEEELLHLQQKAAVLGRT